MTRRRRHHDEHDDTDAPGVDDALGEHELPDESDMDDSDEAGVDDCPHCGKPIAEDAEWCHHCGQYLSREDAPWRPPALWVIVGAALALLVVLMWIL